MLEFEAMAEPGGDIQALANAGIGYIILHKEFLTKVKLGELRKHLSNEIGPAIYEDGRILAFKLQGVSQVAPEPIPIN